MEYDLYELTVQYPKEILQKNIKPGGYDRMYAMRLYYGKKKQMKKIGHFEYDPVHGKYGDDFQILCDEMHPDLNVMKTNWSWQDDALILVLYYLKPRRGDPMFLGEDFYIVEGSEDNYFIVPEEPESWTCQMYVKEDLRSDYEDPFLEDGKLMLDDVLGYSWYENARSNLLRLNYKEALEYNGEVHLDVLDGDGNVMDHCMLSHYKDI